LPVNGRVVLAEIRITAVEKVLVADILPVVSVMVVMKQKGFFIEWAELAADDGADEVAAIAEEIVRSYQGCLMSWCSN
jgi:hypothetical protein